MVRSCSSVAWSFSNRDLIRSMDSARFESHRTSSRQEGGFTSDERPREWPSTSWTRTGLNLNPKLFHQKLFHCQADNQLPVKKRCTLIIYSIKDNGMKRSLIMFTDPRCFLFRTVVEIINKCNHYLKSVCSKLRFGYNSSAQFRLNDLPVFSLDFTTRFPSVAS